MCLKYMQTLKRINRVIVQCAGTFITIDTFLYQLDIIFK